MGEKRRNPSREERKEREAEVLNFLCGWSYFRETLKFFEFVPIIISE